MSRDDLITMLLNNLEIIIDFYDDDARESKSAEMGHYIDAAENYITTEGITLNYDDIGDCLLVVMYASWLYEKRRSSDPGMPRMLRWTLNNRLMSEKMEP